MERKAAMRVDGSESLLVSGVGERFPRIWVAGGLGDDGSIFGGCGNDGRSGSGSGGGASSSLSALTGAFPAACRSPKGATMHHFVDPAHDLVRGVLSGVEPNEVYFM